MPHCISLFGASAVSKLKRRTIPNEKNKPTQLSKCICFPTLFILLSLLAIGVIPFAQAQPKRDQTRRAGRSVSPNAAAESLLIAQRAFKVCQEDPVALVQYTISQIGGSIVPGTTDTGNHGDDTVVTIALPFPFCLYDQTFNSINLSSNGNAQFTDHRRDLHEPMPAVAHPQLHHLPILDEPLFGKQRVRHLYLDKWQLRPTASLNRVAGAVLPGER